MVVKPLDAESPRCLAGDHPGLMPHQLADLHAMRRIEASCHSLPVPCASFYEESPLDDVRSTAPQQPGQPPGQPGQPPGQQPGQPPGQQTVAAPNERDEVRATVRMGILADKPGAGKSFAVMELLLNETAPAPAEVYH